MGGQGVREGYCIGEEEKKVPREGRVEEFRGSDGGWVYYPADDAGGEERLDGWRLRGEKGEEGWDRGGRS